VSRADADRYRDFLLELVAALRYPYGADVAVREFLEWLVLFDHLGGMEAASPSTGAGAAPRSLLPPADEIDDDGNEINA
jgi:hypothetical protein